MKNPMNLYGFLLLIHHVKHQIISDPQLSIIGIIIIGRASIRKFP